MLGTGGARGGMLRPGLETQVRRAPADRARSDYVAAERPALT
jgi:hypothetical protein